MANNDYIPKTVFKFLWYFSKKYKFTILLLFLITIISNILISYAAPYIIKIIINLYESKQLNMGNFILLIGTYIFLINISSLSFIFCNKLFLMSQDMIKKDFSNEVFSRMLDNDLDYFNRNYSGDLTSKITGLMASFQNIFKRLINISNAVLFLGVGLIIILNFNLYIGFIAIIWLIIFYFSLKKLIAIRMERFKIRSEAVNKSSGIINDCLMNISNIKSFSHEKREIKNIKKQSLNIIRSSSNTVGISSAVMFIVYLMKSTYFFIVISLLFYLFRQNTLSLGEFMFMFQISKNLANYVNHGMDSFMQINPEIANFQNSLDKILIKPKIKDREGAVDLKPMDGRIVLRNVCFSY